MKGINTIIPESIDVKEGKKSQSGKWYYSYGIKVDGDWYNGVLYEKSHAEALAKHEGEIELYFYEEEYKGEMKKKCKTVIPKDRENDEILKRLTALEDKVALMGVPEQQVKTETKTTEQSEPENLNEDSDLPF